MNIFKTELFPYIQGDMLKDIDRLTLTIRYVRMEQVTNDRGEQTKPVVFFQERPKGLVLNKTNARVIAGLYGPETDTWSGKRINLYAEPGKWFGKEGWAVRVENLLPPPAAPKSEEQLQEEQETIDSINEALFD